jgi:vacuolar-type H+-ATPase subunit I/STV1
MIFAQDIPLLNSIASKFEKSLDINNASKVKLQEEETKLKAIRAELEKNLLEAKKVFTVYETITNGFANRTDPVEAYISEMESEIQAKIASDTKIAEEQKRQIELKAIAERQAQSLAVQLKEQEELNKTKLAEELRLAEIANKKALEDARILTEVSKQVFTSPPSTPVTQQKTESSQKSSPLPLLIGAGILATIFLGGGSNE